MERKRQLRMLLKLRAKGLLITNFGVCIVITIIMQAIPMLGGYAAELVLPPTNELLYAPDISVYYPQMLRFYSIILGVTMLASPLTMGAYAWFSALSMLRRPRIREAFNWLGDLHLTLKAFGATLWFAGICLAWAIAFLGLPVATVLFVSAKGKAMAVGSILFLSGLIALLTIAGIILTVVRAYSYLPALFVLAAYPDMHIREAFRECGLFMAGRRWEFMELVLSFVGWFLLESFTCGLVTLYVRPYFNLSVLSFAQQARGAWLLENGKACMDTVWTPNNSIHEEDGMDV